MKKLPLTAGLTLGMLADGGAIATATPIDVAGTSAGGYSIRHNYDTVATTFTSFGGSSSPHVGQEQSGTPKFGANNVTVFELPELAAGYMVDTALLESRVHIAYDGLSDDGPFGVDLWGIGFQNSLTEIGDYLDGDVDGNAGHVKIQNDWFIEQELGNAAWSTISAAASETLGAYLQTFYDANPGYAGGSYVYLRLNPDKDPRNLDEQHTGYRVYVASHAPKLTLTTTPIPEPASLALLGLGGLAVLARRRRN